MDHSIVLPPLVRIAGHRQAQWGRSQLLPIFPGLIATVLILAIQPPAALGHTWRIEKMTSATPSTIQGGIDAASPGDTILVFPGTYHERIDFKGKAVVVTSAAGPEVTIIHGSYEDGSVVSFVNSETRASVLRGFTVTGGGRATPELTTTSGGGIRCKNASPTITNNTITGNSAHSGGGLFIIGPSQLVQPPGPLVLNNIVSHNSCRYLGGAIFIGDSNADVFGNTISGNSGGTDGGGINIRSSFGGSVTVAGNRITKNVAGDHGGGIIAYSNPTLQYVLIVIRSNIIAENTALGEHAPLLNGTGGGLHVASGRSLVEFNSIVRNSSSGESECAGGGVLLYRTNTDCTLRNNIIAFNMDCGVACRETGVADLRRNILWGNTPNDLGSSGQPCPEISSSNLYVDPQFCRLDQGDYRVAAGSPALSVPGNPIGAESEPGCQGVSTILDSWSGIKARFSSEPTRSSQH